MTRLNYLFSTFWCYERIVYKNQRYTLDIKMKKREFISRLIAGIITMSPIIILNHLDLHFSYLIIIAFILSTIVGQFARYIILPKNIENYLHKIEKGE